MNLHKFNHLDIGSEQMDFNIPQFGFSFASFPFSCGRRNACQLRELTNFQLSQLNKNYTKLENPGFFAVLKSIFYPSTPKLINLVFPTSSR